MPNIVQAWLELIGTPDRAARLQAAMANGWHECPSRALYGNHAYNLYVNPRYTRALDAWDTGLVTRRDVLQWAAHVASGTYRGPVYQQL
jgi:hypothetical protein